ncbi:MAG: GNAT family N-acyltransferase [Sulfitobacter sp.]
MSKANFTLKIASTPADLIAAQRLRYDVFIEELGGAGTLVDHDARLEKDRFDAFADHLILFDNISGQAVGVYRLLRENQARKAGQYYSENEYDLSVLTSSGRPLLELGRSCLHRDYRGGTAMLHLWRGLASYIEQHSIEVLFGVASFHGTDIADLAAPLSMLHQRHLAPQELRVRAKASKFQSMDLVPEKQLDRRRAMIATPALIKAYLRLGGFVGEGAYVDHAFNTTDVCLVLDVHKMNARQARIYQGFTL